MLRKAASIRYLSNSVGTIFTVANLLIVTYLLDIYQFALWGVANSLVYIFSSFGQLTYVQYIEKYFPTYSNEKMNYYLYKFLKTIFLLIFLWFLVLYLLKYVGYFDKYNEYKPKKFVVLTDKATSEQLDILVEQIPLTIITAEEL